MLSVDNYKLFVTKGKLRAPISLSRRMGDDDTLTGLPKAAIDTAARKVTLAMTEPCRDRDVTFPFDRLEARLANITVLAAHRVRAATSSWRSAQARAA